MNRMICALILALSLLLSGVTTCQSWAGNMEETARRTEAAETAEIADHELIVVYEEEPLTRKELLDDGVISQEMLLETDDEGPTVSVVTIGEDTSLKKAMKELSKEDGIEAVQENFTYQLQDHPYYYEQTDLTRALKELGKEKSGGTVAVLDTGISYAKNRRHQTLTDVTDGGNIYYEYGYNAETDKLFQESGWNEDPYYEDYIGHGTGIASLILGNVLPVNVFKEPQPDKYVDSKYQNYNAEATTSTLIRAYGYVMEHAKELDIHVINLSLAGTGIGDQALESVINEAYEKGILTVAAAGNSGSSQKLYPAAFAKVVSVGSVTKKHTWSLFSQHNGEVDLCAPGEDISVALAGKLRYYDEASKTFQYRNYDTKQMVTRAGTSYSVPIVASVAAMICDAGGNLSCDQMRSILLNSCEDLGPKGRDDYFGAGELNAYYAIRSAMGKSVTRDVTIPKLTLKSDGVTLKNTSYTYDGKAKKPAVDVTAGGITLAKGETASGGNVTLTYASGRKNVGTYSVTVKGLGCVTGSVKKTFVINPQKSKITTLTGKSKSFLVKWKKITAQASGYQIRYGTDAAMKQATQKTVSGYKNTSLTVKKLKAKKYYYVQVRTYKTVDKKKYYSAWSEAKKVKTK